MIKRTLHLYGPLADRYGARHIVFANDFMTALQIVTCNHPTFLATIQRGTYYCANGNGRLTTRKEGDGIFISLGKSQAKEIPAYALDVPRSLGDWHLIPALEGAKSKTFKAVFTIVVGGALLATGAGGIAAGALGISGSTVGTIATSLVLGGISQLLAPSVKTSTADSKPTSFSFDGPAEINDEGGPIPLLYGELVIGSFAIASSIESTGTGGTSLSSAVATFGKGGGGHAFSEAQLY